jgi:hypothetical protein
MLAFHSKNRKISHRLQRCQAGERCEKYWFYLRRHCASRACRLEGAHFPD